MGASVAVALALKQPKFVDGLVLASEYYFPTARPDFLVLSAPAVPGIGDILTYTFSPIIGRTIWPLLMREIFGPRSVPKKFDGFPKAMAVRPSQIPASAAALMMPAAYAFNGEYASLKMPLVIIAGEDDRLVDIDEQSGRLHGHVTQSKMHRVPGTVSLSQYDWRFAAKSGGTSA